jgi:hypothetical protein
MTRGECEKAIRVLCHKWREDCGLSNVPVEELHFSQFISWVRENYSSYLSFRSRMSPEYDAELWFDQEFNQLSRR